MEGFSNVTFTWTQKHSDYNLLVKSQGHCYLTSILFFVKAIYQKHMMGKDELIRNFVVKGQGHYDLTKLLALFLPKGQRSAS